MRWNVVSLLISLPLVACAAGAGDRRDGDVVAHRDSAGITIVESPGSAWSSFSSWKVDSVPIRVIGASTVLPSGLVTADEAQFVQIVSTHFLADGRMVIADRGASQVMIFDSSGVLENRFLGAGDGPSELRFIVNMHVCDGDSIVVAGTRDVLVFDSNGEFARRTRFNEGGEGWLPIGVSNDCGSVIAQRRVSIPPLDEIGYLEHLFVWLDPIEQRIDTVLLGELQEGWTRRDVVSGGVDAFVIPWGTSPWSPAVIGDHLVVSSRRRAELGWYDSRGALTAILRWEGRPPPITRSDRRRYSGVRSSWLAAMAGNPEAPFRLPELSEMPDVPSSRPLIERVLADDEGNLWVRGMSEGSFGEIDYLLQERTWSNQVWTVFDAQGAWLGDVTLPGHFDLKSVAHGRLLGIVRDSLHVETVHIYGLARP